ELRWAEAARSGARAAPERRTTVRVRLGRHVGRLGLAVRSADIPRRAEARLITERDKRGGVARMRNGCTQTADGAIAVAGARRAAAPGAASRAYLPWARVPARRGGPRRAALTMILAEPEAVAAARTSQSLAGRACRVVPVAARCRV